MGTTSASTSVVSASSKEISDRKALGYALHQLGTREVCLGNLKLGRDLLNQAKKLRQALGDQEAVELTQHNLGFLSKTKFEVPSFLKKAILPVSITSVAVLGGVSYSGYHLLRIQQEAMYLREQNQRLMQDIASLKSEKSVNSIRERELVLIIEKITKERDTFRQDVDGLNNKLDEADKRAKDAVETLERKRSTLSIHGAMVPLSVNVEMCRKMSLVGLESLKTEVFESSKKQWGQDAEVQNYGTDGALIMTQDQDGVVHMMCTPVGNRSVVSISSASSTAEGFTLVKVTHGSLYESLRQVELN